MSSRVDTLQTQGVNDVFEYNEIHLDSQQADNRLEGPEHPRFAITPPISAVIGIKLLSAQIPFSWDIVTPDNNKFIIDGTTYTLPPGNYTLTQLLDTLNDIAAVNSLDTPAPAVWGFDPRTGTLNLHNGGTSLIPSTTMVIGKDGPYSIFGMNAPDTIKYGGSLLPYHFPGQVNVTGSNYLLLTSSALAGRLAKNIRINGETTAHPLVLAKIPVSVNPGSIILYTDASPGYCFDMGMEQLQHIDLILLSGDDLKPVVPKSPWSVSLMVLSQRDTSVPRIRDVPTKNGTAKRLRVS